MRFLFHLDLSLHAGAGKKLEFEILHPNTALVGHDHDAVPFSLLRLRLCHERRDMMGMKEREGRCN